MMAYKTWFLDETSKAGAFVRQKNQFTTPFGEGEGELPVVAGKYRLIWSQACPWAHRQVIVLSLLGLREVISIGTVDPVRPEKERSDWAFTLDERGEDPVLKVKFLSDLYLNAKAGYRGRFTVPAIVDIETKKVVNNDYFNLTYYWETVWKKYHKPNVPDLLPEHLRNDIFKLNDIIFNDINNGVYKAGFARSQQAYEKAYDLVFGRLDEFEQRLSQSRFLFGDTLTDSDVRLYVTLARFDAAYYSVFRLNRQRLVDFPNLWAYARRLYQIPEFGGTTDFDAIKKHYHICCDPGNESHIVPKGPDVSVWKTKGT
ncbi:MAG: glutathione S-transferase C-terminal domain-containing protein [Tannerella sp.]|jgi:putative glutathione S-transferase|nr:glutathione S-transferase C-terminal domain-containing protein [Tannerella sp.]